MAVPTGHFLITLCDQLAANRLILLNIFATTEVVEIVRNVTSCIWTYSKVRIMIPRSPPYKAHRIYLQAPCTEPKPTQIIPPWKRNQIVARCLRESPIKLRAQL